MSWLYNVVVSQKYPWIQLTRDQASVLRYQIIQLINSEKTMRKSYAPNTYQTIKGSIIRETEKAVRFDICQAGHILDGEAFWFPLSQIKSITRSHNECEDEIEIADWLVEAKANEIAGSGGGGY